MALDSLLNKHQTTIAFCQSANQHSIEMQIVMAFLLIKQLTIFAVDGIINNRPRSARLYYFINNFLMRTTLLLVFALFALTHAITDKEIIQQGLNGLFEENKLPDSSTVVPCIDNATAHKIVVFIGEILEKAAKGSVSDLISLVSLIKSFGDQIPQEVKDCLNGNKELETLGYKYGVTPTTDSSVIEKKVIAYVTLHYLQVHKWLGELNSNWKAAKYYQVGFDAATYGHKVLGITPAQIARLRSQ